MNLFNLDDFELLDVMNVIKLAQEFKNGREVDFKQKKIVGNLFFETSTRTHYSFDVAANRLGCKTINFVESNSATQKGETLYDTVKTFESFDVDALVIRHSKDRYYEDLIDISVPILSGGDGSGNHPTQSLLDLMTIYEEFGGFDNLTITICGDIKHSRVARTNYNIMTKLGMKVNFVAPQDFQSDYGEYINIDQAVENSNIIMLLRVQNERHETTDKYMTKSVDYNSVYGMNKQRLDKLKDDTIIMHPGPFNRGVELTDDVVDYKKTVINKQVNNGVYIRMAVLYEALCN